MQENSRSIDSPEWERMFQALVEFKATHASLDTSAPWADNPELADWVSDQTILRQEGRLSATRARRLALGGSALAVAFLFGQNAALTWAWRKDFLGEADLT